MVGMTGMQQPEKSFEQTMTEDLMEYAPIIKRWLRARFPSMYSPELAFDCHSLGMLSILEAGYTGLTSDQRQHIMFKRGTELAGAQCQQRLLPERSADGYYTRDNVNFKDLNPDFVNFLTLRRRRVWRLRCEGKKMTEIAEVLNISTNLACVCAYQIRKQYVKWLAMRNTFIPDYYDYIPHHHYYHEVTKLRYEDGCSIEIIADRLGIGPRYVCTTLYRVQDRKSVV